MSAVAESERSIFLKRRQEKNGVARFIFLSDSEGAGRL
jgi:hypothetical protein